METKKNYRKTIAKNRKALHDFSILETFEMGIVLKGSELKPIRSGKVNLSGSYALVNFKEEIILKGMHVGSYDEASYMMHECMYDRKLLAHRKEIKRIDMKLKKNRLTMVPLELYLKNRWVKINIALVSGKKKADLRQEIKKRDIEREMDRFRKKSR